MNASTRLPHDAEAWLTELHDHLHALDPSLRQEIVDGFRAHIIDSSASDSGEAMEDVLTALGTPAETAARVLDEQREATGNDPARYRWGAKRITQIVALALTIAATLALLIIPSYTSVSEDSTGEETIETLPLLSVVGAWYLIVLALPIVFTIAPLIPKHRRWQTVSIVSTILLVLFAMIGSLSIGYYYIPAAIAAIVAVFLSTTGRRTHPRSFTGRAADGDT